MSGTIVVTTDGHPYDPDADVWTLPTPGGPAHFDFHALTGTSAALRAGAKKAMSTSLSRLATQSVHADFTSVCRLIRCADASKAGRVVEEITAELVRAHDASLAVGSRYQAGRLSVALRRWAASGAGGLAGGLSAWLTHEATPSHSAGQAVRTCSRAQGALLKSERDALLAALHGAYDAGRVILTDYAMALLVAVLGLRPLQVVCLKIGDLRPSSKPGVFVADLMVTRLKQKGGRRPREEFTAYGLVPALADVVHRQCAQATGQAARFGVALPDAPLFPAQGCRDVALPGLVGHLSVGTISRRIGRTFDRLGALRDRPGGGEHVFPLRLRRTLATILFGENAGLAEISILLDHTGTESALAYIEASPTLSPRLDAAMSVPFQELAARILHGGAAIEPASDAAPRS